MTDADIVARMVQQRDYHLNEARIWGDAADRARQVIKEKKKIRGFLDVAEARSAADSGGDPPVRRVHRAKPQRDGGSKRALELMAKASGQRPIDKIRRIFASTREVLAAETVRERAHLGVGHQDKMSLGRVLTILRKRGEIREARGGWRAARLDKAMMAEADAALQASRANGNGHGAAAAGDA